MAKCSNCDVEMMSNGIVRLQMGEANVFFPNMSNIIAGSLELELKSCSSCGKVEFYKPYSSGGGGGTVRCKNCGNVHQSSRCPRCQQSG